MNQHFRKQPTLKSLSGTIIGLFLTGSILMPLPLFSQQAELSSDITDNVKDSLESSLEVQEDLDENTPRLVQPEEMGPSLDEARKQGNQQSNLEELLAVPFEQIQRKEESNTTAEIDDITDSEKEDLPEPTEPQQNLAEQKLEEQLDILLQEMLPQEYVGNSVSIKYFIETVPVSKNLKKISKIKLPGFDNHVWVPTKSKQILGIVNQTRTYTTIFVVVNTPISPFNIEVLRQSSFEKN